MGNSSADKYCRPDRSDYIPNLTNQRRNDPLDIGWFEGELSDNRPFRAECWQQDHLKVLTLFFSMAEIEHLSQTSLRNLLAKEGLVTYLSNAFVMGSAFTDAIAQHLWSVSVIMAEHGKLMARECFELKSYEPTGK
jgi:hypothetical protein